MQEFAYDIEKNIFDLRARLVSQQWTHDQYTMFHVCDPKPRIVHKATVSNRIVHHAIVRHIEPLFERSFIFDTWSCRTGKGTHAAMLRAHEKLRELSQKTKGEIWVLQCDIKKYFQSVDHDILTRILQKNIIDTETLTLLRNIIDSFSPGIPLGNLTSQLFANIYLNPFDHFVKEILRPASYIRYCDDFFLTHPSREYLVNCYRQIDTFLKTRLHLTLHPNKIHLHPFRYGIDFLGHVLYPDGRRLRHVSRKRMQRRVQEAVNELSTGKRSYASTCAIIASYKGMVQYASSHYDDELLDLLKQCL